MKNSLRRPGFLISVFLSLFLATFLPNVPAQEHATVQFPDRRPRDGNFNRPAPDETLDVSPPGFCWWRVGKRGEFAYRLRVRNEEGGEIYASPLVEEPVHVPDKVFPPGRYTWIVEALNVEGVPVAIRHSSRFIIAEKPIPLPWVPLPVLLARVSKEHPRLLFPKPELEEIKKTLGTTRKEAFNDLKAVADEALSLPIMKKPDFDKFDRENEYPARRTAYTKAYTDFTLTYNRGMVPLALVYVLTGEKKYGEAAKAHLLNTLDWGIDGVASLETGFDEIGLRIAHTAPQAYDWCYDLFTSEERRAVEAMLVARGNQMLDRLKKRDFLNTSGFSHDGRLPGYLVEFSIVLAERPEATEWMDYAMKTLLTVFPHWADNDGGWAEGIHYSLSYHERFITPLQSLYAATGYDLWQKPFFRKFRYFLMYCISPRGEALPFGDMEHVSIGDRADYLRSTLQFHALRYSDPVALWWAGLVKKQEGDPDRLPELHRFILPESLTPRPPVDMPPDRAFHGIGWAALHSNPTMPDDDLMVLFKSSPFGAVSHSHADQNSFAILKGGKALAIPAGARYPQHGSPFHTEYTQQTVAHNALLINGRGQINQLDEANGRLTAFQSLPHMSYATGEAQKCYGAPVTRYLRHVVLVRPSLILVVDDLEASEQVETQWLLHAKDPFELNEKDQLLVSRRGNAAMTARLFTPGGFTFSQSDAWPVDPTQDYPMVTRAPPAKQWHFSARTLEKSRSVRIASVMTVNQGADKPECKVRRVGKDTVEILARFGDIGKARAVVRLSSSAASSKPIVEIRYEPKKGEVELLRIP